MRFSRKRARWIPGFLACAIAMHAASVHSLDSPGPVHDPGERPFELTDQNGERVTDRSFRGKWLLVYFGFTSCPDVCPTSMSEIAEVVRLLGPVAGRLRVVFITVDPDRDSPRVLSQYLANFSGSFTGLTGTKAQIAQVLTTFDAYAAPEANRDNGTYRLGHSSSFYLIDPSGHFQRRLSPETGPQVLAAILRRVVGTP